MGSPSKLLSLIAILSSIGCNQEGPPPPATFKAAGVIRYQNSQPVAGGLVQFVSKDNSNHTMSARTANDGTFQLQTIHRNENVEGAIEGPCEVMVTLPFQEGQIPDVLVLKETYTIQPKDNYFDIRVPR